MRGLCAGFVVLAVLCPPASGQTLVGPEFPVNTFTTGQQSRAAVAVAGSGNFVVVWRSADQDGSGYGIFGRTFDASGVALGSEFGVNAYTASFQDEPAVAAGANGDFVVVWTSDGQDGSSTGIFGRRFNASGVAQTSEFPVNSHTTGLQAGPSVASDGAGNFVVVWASYGQDGDGIGVRGQRFNASGVALGVEFQVNSYTTGTQARPAVALDADGDFVVVWDSNGGNDGNGYGVFGQRYSSSGVPRGAEFQVNSFTTGAQLAPGAASDANGNFVAVWISPGQDGSSAGIFGQRFSALGVAQGPEFRVNSYTTELQNLLSVASDKNGNFVVVWQSWAQDGSNYGIFGQRFNASGAPKGSEFQVNTYTTGRQDYAAIATNADGQFVIAWASAGQDGNSAGVFAQRASSDLIFADGFE